MWTTPQESNGTTSSNHQQLSIAATSHLTRKNILTAYQLEAVSQYYYFTVHEQELNCYSNRA
eukprot:scaffold2206_cov236-Chaetoceros_neogracile.AAC.2